jgi:hypothetical protein
LARGNRARPNWRKIRSIFNTVSERRAAELVVALVSRRLPVALPFSKN